MNSDRLTRLEQRIEYLVEGSFARLFQGRLQPRDIASRLARAVEDNTRVDDQGAEYAPTQYQVLINADDFNVLQAQSPSLAQSLAELVVDLANRFNLRLDGVPTVTISPHLEVPPRKVNIVASHLDAARSTQMLPALPQQTVSRSHHGIPQLIGQGREPFPLIRNVTNIGRKKDNHIVLDDARVSRKHAQIRLRFGRYVLYDLGSTSGTLVNNHRVKETILEPGDVISIAGILLVYIEDQSDVEHDPQSDTQVRRVRNDWTNDVANDEASYRSRNSSDV
jgi:hypothetical protein